MNNTTDEINIIDFQNQVLEEVDRINGVSRKKDGISHDAIEPDYGIPGWIMVRGRTYFQIEQELEKSRLFLNKEKIKNLIEELRKDDKSALEKVRREVRQHIRNSERWQLEAQQKEMQQKRADDFARDEATKAILKKDIRKYLCPILQSASHDVNEIAKLITPILIPLILAGTLTIRLEPVIFAHLAMIIARMGVAGICDEYMSKQKKTSSTA